MSFVISCSILFGAMILRKPLVKIQHSMEEISKNVEEVANISFKFPLTL